LPAVHYPAALAWDLLFCISALPFPEPAGCIMQNGDVRWLRASLDALRERAWAAECEASATCRRARELLARARATLERSEAILRGCGLAAADRASGGRSDR
jgi:hypothetical protein